MHPAVAEQKALMRTEARRRPVRHLWIYLTVRECGALSRGQVSRRLRRDFDGLLNGWKAHTRHA
jgi:hypothetical protein